MPSENFQPGTSALLIMDYQQLLVDGFAPEPDSNLAVVANVLAQSRAAGVSVIYVTVGFREGYPEVSDNNMIFTAVREGQRFMLGGAGSSIPDQITPAYRDIVVVKHRVSAFEGTDLAMVLRAHGADTLVLFGITTSGVVLSTVRQAADLDYKLVVLEDLCYDGDDQVHKFLMADILCRQAKVMQSDEYLSSL